MGRLVVPLRERRHPGRPERRGATARPAARERGGAASRSRRGRSKAWRSSRTVPNEHGADVERQAHRLPVQREGSERPRRRDPRPRATGTGCRAVAEIGILRPSRIQSNRISKTPRRSGPMNVFGRMITTSRPGRRPTRLQSCSASIFDSPYQPTPTSGSSSSMGCLTRGHRTRPLMRSGRRAAPRR